MNKIKISLVDDHVMLRNGLADLLGRMDFEIISQASSGNDFMESLQNSTEPDVVLMDINMPGMDGFATTSLLQKKYPLVKVVALSMYDTEYSIIRMLKSGAKGFIVKDADPLELKGAIENVIAHGFHYSEQVTGKVLHAALNNDSEDILRRTPKLSDREISFLKLAATEMTYQQIAAEMFVSPRTVDGYRDGLFEKLNIKSRVGLVLYAIRNKIVHID